MKLAEALALRAEAARRIEQLRSRIVDNARYQEGEEPTEDAAALLVQTSQACAELESLIRWINRTNASAQMGSETITDAIARRDVLKLRHGIITAAADAAAGRERGWSCSRRCQEHRGGTSGPFDSEANRSHQLRHHPRGVAATGIEPLRGVQEVFEFSR